MKSSVGSSRRANASSLLPISSPLCHGLIAPTQSHTSWKSKHTFGLGIWRPGSTLELDCHCPKRTSRHLSGRLHTFSEVDFEMSPVSDWDWPCEVLRCLPLTLVSVASTQLKMEMVLGAQMPQLIVFRLNLLVRRNVLRLDCPPLTPGAAASCLAGIPNT